MRKKLLLILAYVSLSLPILPADNNVSNTLHTVYNRIKPCSGKLPSTKKLVIGATVSYGLFQFFQSREEIASFIISRLTQHEKMVLATLQRALQDKIAHRQSCFEKLPSLSMLTFLGSTALGYFLLRPFYPESYKDRIKEKTLFSKIFNTVPRCVLAIIIGYWLTAEFQDKSINFPTTYPMTQMGNSCLAGVNAFFEWASK